MIQTDKIDLLTKSLVSFQSSQEPVSYNATNPFLKNKYADLTQLVNKTKDNLSKNGLAVSQLLCGRGVTTLLIHESGQFIGDTAEIEPTEGKGTNSAQQMGVAISYTRRYAYASILGLVTDEDTDGATKDKSDEGKNKKQDNKTEDKKDGLLSKKQLNLLGILWEKRKEELGIPKDDNTGIREILEEYKYTSRKEVLAKHVDEIIEKINNYKPLPF